MTLKKTISNARTRETSKDLEIKTELRQENPFSMLLFYLMLKNIIRDSKGNRERSLMYKSHQILSYGDDVALVARHPKELKNITKVTIDTAYRTRLKVNQEQNTIMSIGSHPLNSKSKIAVTNCENINLRKMRNSCS